MFRIDEVFQIPFLCIIPFLLGYSYDGKSRGRVSRSTVPENKNNSSNNKGKPMHELSSNTTDDLDHEWPFSDEEDEDASDQSLDREDSIKRYHQQGRVVHRVLNLVFMSKAQN